MGQEMTVGEVVSALRDIVPALRARDVDLDIRIREARAVIAAFDAPWVPLMVREALAFGGLQDSTDPVHLADRVDEVCRRLDRIVAHANRERRG